ncbi:MAG: penicillin-binding protein activator [Bacteroidetes bacterium]|jgi:ABC-type branched-subunit amino acid transport system substrate-binding protein|nr:penicillin-binding protein activator [Bacteroidota bacterium]
MNRPPILFVFCVVLALPLAAQSVPDSAAFDAEGERAFVQAMRTFQSGAHDSAVVQLQGYLREFPRGHRWTGASIMLGKALYERGRWRESIRQLKDLLDIAPETLYRFDARYSIGLNYFRMNRYEDAALEFLAVRENSPDSLLIGRSERMLDALASEHLTASQIDGLQAEARDSTVLAMLTFRAAEMLQRNGDTRRAIELLRGLAAQPRWRWYVPEAVELLERLEKGRTLKIGAVLPLLLSSQRPGVREVGVEFLNGMNVAVEQFNRGSITKVALEIRDTERDPSAATRAVSELADDADVVAVLGPISSNEAFAAAGVAHAKGLPMLTPTATSNGIAAVGSNIFQGNPDYDARGRAMAAYAWERLGARTFGVLAPTDAVGKLVADGFVDEVKRRQGDLVSVQWYYAGSTDLRSQLEEMRVVALKRKIVPYFDFSSGIRHEHVNAMLMAGASQRIVDSLMESGGTMSVDSLLGPIGRSLVDSLRLPTKLPVINYDSLGIAVDSIHAIFVPIASSEEIGVVSSQISLFNFQTAILGTADWNDPAELDRNRRYTNGVYFSIDAMPNTQDRSYRTFVTSYQAMAQRPPTVNALIGFDAAQLVLDAITRGATLRREIAEALSTVRGHRGLHGVVSFQPNRVNGAMGIMRYLNGSMTKVGEIDLTALPTEAAARPETPKP